MYTRMISRNIGMKKGLKLCDFWRSKFTLQESFLMRFSVRKNISNSKVQNEYNQVQELDLCGA